MSNVEVYRVGPSLWARVRCGLLVLWAFASGYALGRPDPRDWSRSTQTTNITMTDPATGMQQIQYQTGVTESLTAPDPNAGKAYNLFGADKSDGQDK